MDQFVFVKVVGFKDVERHALNTVFRLSQDRKLGREWAYVAWEVNAPKAPGLVLIDGSDGSAAVELEALRGLENTGLIWVGSIAPASAWRTFVRPLQWHVILKAMDDYILPPAAKALDFDLESTQLFEPGSTEPAPLHPSFYSPQPGSATTPNTRFALVVDADREARLYLRTRLAVAGITHVDEAETLGEAQIFLAQQTYHFVSLDLDIRDKDPWQTVAAARQKKAVVLLTGLSIGIAVRMNAKRYQCHTMQKPLIPEILFQLLRKL